MRQVASSAFGTLAPGPVDRAVIALTARLPNNWLGRHIAIILRRITTMRLPAPEGALDVDRWGLKLRLHPRDNGCEKNLLFTPQMFETEELGILAAAIERAKRENRQFVFVDVGANVGLFSLFVAAAAGIRSRIIAVEPEEGNFARLSYNIAANPGVPIRPIAVALSGENGKAGLVLNRSDRGGTHIRRPGETESAVQQYVVQRTLLDLLGEENVQAIDALKIDIEGAEDRVLVPFFERAPKSLWPRLILIEDSPAYWKVDLLALLFEKGYAEQARSKLNVMLRLD